MMSNVNPKDAKLLRSSGLFDERWYLEQYPDVTMLGMDAVEHYLWLGAKLRREISPNFKITGYQKTLDQSARALNPAIHYLQSKYSAGGNFEDYLTGRDEVNASTYDGQRKYPFLSAGELEERAKDYKEQKSSSPNVVFFTAITGGYDHVSHHEHLIAAAEYVLFSEEGESRYIYQGRPTPYHDADSVRSARFVKTHAHALFAQKHKIAVWLDGNILVRDDLKPLVERFAQSGKAVGAIPHPLRRSVYDEADECIRRGKDDRRVIEAQMQRYKALKFDCDDLVETNLMIFRLDHPQLKPFLETWWSEIERGSRRDQLSFNYAIKTTGTEWFALSEWPNSVRNNPSLALFHHGTNAAQPILSLSDAAAPAPSYAEVMNTRIERHTGKPVDIVVCVHNALRATMECLQSVAASRDEKSHRILIVDDGSEEETASWLSTFAKQNANVRLIRNEKALGYTKAANIGLRASDGDLVILLNSDTIVAKPWIEKLLDAVVSNPDAGITGPLSSAASHQSIPDSKSTAQQTAVNDMPPGYDVEKMNRWCEANAPADFLPRVPLVHGFCFAITREVISKIGYLDEEGFPHGYGEENDYCFRAANAGFSLAIATHTYVFHEKSQSYQSERRQMLTKAGNQKIRELHTDQRVVRAIESMQQNPHLKRMRELSRSLFGR
jgi:GT2 family glycosyltransferase